MLYSHECNTPIIKEISFWHTGIISRLYIFFFRRIPKGATAVTPFNTEKYLGTWYEIARFDYKWERNLDHVTATYTKRSDGKIKVDNKGYNTKTKKWQESIGKAKPASDPNVAELKVCFFGPFYAGYNVIALDSNYTYALVAGSSTRYLWLLSRERTMPEHVKQSFIEKAKAIGFKTEQLVWVKQD
jgi:apolipoprotein D and lipocalin family protein